MTALWEGMGPNRMKPAVQPRVLFVEDDPGIRKLYEKVFAPCNWELDFAVSAELAIDTLTTHPAHAYIVDKDLPGADGISFIRQLRRVDYRARCILITGFSNRDTAIQCANLGVDSYIEKPCRITDLKTFVEGLMASSHLPSPFEVKMMRFFSGAGDVAGNDSDTAHRVLLVTDQAGARARIEDALADSTWTHAHARDALASLDYMGSHDVSVAFVQLGAVGSVELQTIRDRHPGVALTVFGGPLALEQAQRLIELRVCAIVASVEEMVELCRNVAGPG